MYRLNSRRELKLKTDVVSIGVVNFAKITEPVFTQNIALLSADLQKAGLMVSDTLRCCRCCQKRSIQNLLSQCASIEIVRPSVYE
jgi:hypothetical protein